MCVFRAGLEASLAQFHLCTCIVCLRFLSGVRAGAHRIPFGCAGERYSTCAVLLFGFALPHALVISAVLHILIIALVYLSGYPQIGV